MLTRRRILAALTAALFALLFAVPHALADDDPPPAADRTVISRGEAVALLAQATGQSPGTPLEGDRGRWQRPLKRGEGVELLQDYKPAAEIQAWFTGPSDGDADWQPHKPVTRRQWIDLLAWAVPKPAPTPAPNPDRTVAGTVTALASAQGGLPATLTLDQAYTLSASAVVTYNGQPITFGDLQVGDGVMLTVRGSDNLVTALALIQRAPVTLTGLVLSVDPTAGTLTLSTSGSTVGARLPANLPVTYDGLVLGPDSLHMGQTGVSITGILVAGVLYATAATIPITETVRFVALFQALPVGGLTVTYGSQTQTLSISGVLPTFLGAPQAWSTVQVGDALSLTASFGGVAMAAVYSRSNVALQGSAGPVNTAASTLPFTVQVPGAPQPVTMTVQFNAATTMTGSTGPVAPADLSGHQLLVQGDFTGGNTLLATSIQVQG